MKVNLILGTGFNYERTGKALVASKMIEKVLNSERFRLDLMTKKFSLDLGLTNQEIYNRIMLGNEVTNDNNSYDTGDDREMDMIISIKKSNWFNRNVIGFGYAGNLQFYTYDKWFDSMYPAELAGHFSHEWLHKIGFADVKKNKVIKTAVTYVIGYLVDRIASENIYDTNLR